MQPIEAILDCDPGDDDALAILVASRHTRLIAITTVAGNAALEDTTANALRAKDAIGLSVPVLAGCDRPISGQPVQRPVGIHGVHGLGENELEPPVSHPQDGSAVDFIVDTLRSREGITLITTGPLTNIANVFREAPDVVSRIHQLVMMAGAFGPGNRTAAAESNVWADPEAARLVFNAAVKRTMIGLDVTRQVPFTRDDLVRLEETATPHSAFYTCILRSTLAAYERTTGRPMRPMHDPCAVIAAAFPECFAFEPYPVDVELTGELTRGMTVVDRRETRNMDQGTTEVAVAVDVQACRRIILEALGV